MKRLVIAATVVAMFIGTSAFAGDKTTAPQTSTGKATTENVLHAGKKTHKKHQSKKVKKEAAPKQTAPQAAPAKAAPAKK